MRIKYPCQWNFHNTKGYTSPKKQMVRALFRNSIHRSECLRMIVVRVVFPLINSMGVMHLSCFPSASCKHVHASVFGNIANCVITFWSEDTTCPSLANMCNNIRTMWSLCLEAHVITYNTHYAISDILLSTSTFIMSHAVTYIMLSVTSNCLMRFIGRNQH